MDVRSLLSNDAEREVAKIPNGGAGDGSRNGEDFASNGAEKMRSSGQIRQRPSAPMQSTKKPKTYAHPVPSRYCHICSRDSSTRNRRLGHCFNLTNGTCQKAYCHLCCEKYEVKFAEITRPDSRWVCFHCTNDCPPGSRCESYSRAAEKRRMQGLLRRRTVPGGTTPSDGGEEQ